MVEHEASNVRTDGASVRLEIGALELRGFSPARRFAIAAALEAELTSLLTTRGLPSALAPRDDVLAPSVAIDPSGAPQIIGAQIAHAIWESLR